MVCQQEYQHVPSWIQQCSFGSDQTPRHSSDKYLLLNPCVPEKKYGLKRLNCKSSASKSENFSNSTNDV